MITNLKQLRKSKGWTQVETAKQLGISAEYVKKIEANQRVPSLKVLHKMKEVFGCETIDELLRAS